MIPLTTRLTGAGLAALLRVPLITCGAAADGAVTVM
jgi:hypothetical protein